MKNKIAVFLMTLVSVILCAVGGGAEGFFRDVNITDSYGTEKDYYYLGESFSVTAQFYSDDTEDYLADIIVALYDTDGVLRGVDIADKTQQTEYLEASADFIAPDEIELYVKCYMWKNSNMIPVADMSGYYINGKIKSDDVCIDYRDVVDITDTQIKAYTENSTQTTYSLASPCEVIINGKTCKNGIFVLTDYYCNSMSNPVLGDIILKNKNDNNEYAVIEAKIGFTAIADSLLDNTLYYEPYSDEIMASMEVYENTECRVIFDGEEISLSDIKHGDVITIYYDMSKDFYSSSFYEVYVSRKKVSGTVTATTSTAEFVGIDNIKYLISPILKWHGFDAEAGQAVDVFFDAYNKVAYYSEKSIPLQCAVIEDVYSSGIDSYYVQIIKTNGEKATYSIENYDEYFSYVFYDNGNNEYEKYPIQNRVFTYEISSDGNYITFGKRLTPYTMEYGLYREDVIKIGNIGMSEENTNLLDCTLYESYDEVCPIKLQQLTDGYEYTAYAFDKMVDGTYSFVIISATNKVETAETTEFVVYSKSYITEVDGEERLAYLVYDGTVEPIEVVLEDGAAVDGIVEGTPIVVKKNLSGYATEIIPLFAVNNGVTLSDGYSSFANAVRNGMVAGDLSKILNVDALDATLTEDLGVNQSDWVFGMVYDVTMDTITIATDEDVSAGSTVENEISSNVDYLDEYDIDTDAKIMAYRYKERENRGLRVTNTTLSAIPKVSNMSIAFVDSDSTIFNWNHDIFTRNEDAACGRTTFVLAKTSGWIITEIYAIIPSTGN